ncbi:MAG: DMT family transporter [Bacteroidaceae bacterium]|nr:DMT family transporter [Bacteroidaceae bacterium]
MNTKIQKISGHLAAFCAYSIFGFNIILTKDLTNSHIFQPLSLFTLRAIGAGLLFWTLSLFTRKEHVGGKDLFRIFLASLLGFFVTQITFLVGINYSTPLDCAIISTLAPVFTMITAAFALKEPITKLKAGGVVLSFLGILMLILSSSSTMNDPSRVTTPFGIVMLLLNCLSFAMYLGIFRPLIQKYSVVTFMKWIFLYSFIISVPFSAPDILSVNYAAVPGKCYFDLGYLILFATFFSYFLIPVGQKFLRPTLVSLYSYVQPIIASVLGICLGMDTLSVGKSLSIVAVVLGVILVNESKGRDE